MILPLSVLRYRSGKTLPLPRLITPLALPAQLVLASSDLGLPGFSGIFCRDFILLGGARVFVWGLSIVRFFEVFLSLV